MPQDIHLVRDLVVERPVEVRRHSRPLRVAVIGPSRHPVSEPFAGGQEALVHSLVLTLRERGHDVTLFAVAGSQGADREYAFSGTDWSPSEAAGADRSMPARTFMEDHHEHLRLMIALAGELDGRFDVVHNHSLHHLPVAMASTLRTPVVTTLHTPPTPWLESAVAVAGAGVARWTAVSATTARQWERLAGQVDVVRNGVQLDRWRPGPGGGRLVWTGRLVREKAPHLAVQAAALAGWGIDLAGPVGDRAYAEEQLWPLLGDGARYVGHLEQRDLAALVGSSAAALVTPVWEEPFGLVAAEAAACGTPVVAFRQGGIAEVVVDGVTGVLVEPGDVDAMAASLPRAVSLDRSRVRTVAEQTLSLAKAVDGYEAVYDAALRADGRRRRRTVGGWSSVEDSTVEDGVTARA